MVQRIIVKLGCLAGELKKLMFLAKYFHIELGWPQAAQLRMIFRKSEGLYLLDELL